MADRSLAEQAREEINFQRAMEAHYERPVAAIMAGRKKESPDPIKRCLNCKNLKSRKDGAFICKVGKDPYTCEQRRQKKRKAKIASNLPRGPGVHVLLTREDVEQERR